MKFHQLGLLIGPFLLGGGIWAQSQIASVEEGREVEKDHSPIIEMANGGQMLSLEGRTLSRIKVKENEQGSWDLVCTEK